MRWAFFALPFLIICLYLITLAWNDHVVFLPSGGIQVRTDRYYWMVPFWGSIFAPTVGALWFFLAFGGILPARWQPRTALMRFFVILPPITLLIPVLLHAVTDTNPFLFPMALTIPTVSIPLAWWLSRLPWKVRFPGVQRGFNWDLILPFTALLAVIPLVLYATHVYQWQVMVSDSHSQISQARLLLNGHLTHDFPQGLRDVLHIVYAVDSVPAYSMYPPGHLTLLAPFLAITGFPQAMNIAFSLLIVLLLGHLLLKRYGPAVAMVGMFMLACSPHFLVMGSEAMNHTTCALALLVVFWCIWFPSGGNRLPPNWALLLVGFCLGWAFLIRPLTAVAHGFFWLLFGAWMFLGSSSSRPSKKCVLKVILLVSAGAIGPLAYGVVYNLQTTGNPTRFGYMVHVGDVKRFGFGTDRPYPYTPMDAINRLAASLISFNFQMTGWVIGSWVLILVWWKRTRLKPLELSALGLIINQCLVYMLYHYHDLIVGPRFLFEILPFLILLGAIGLAPVLRHGGGRSSLLVLAIMIFGVGSLRDGIDHWRSRYTPMVGTSLQVERLVSTHTQSDQTTIFVLGDARGEASGRFFPPLAGEPRVWFVRANMLEQALHRPELLGATWILPTDIHAKAITQPDLEAALKSINLIID